MKKIILLSMLFIIVAAVNGADLRFNRIAMINDPIYQGDDLRAGLVMENYGDDLENVRVTAYIPELDIRIRARSFDLEGGDDISRRLSVEIPEAEPGLYLVRFTVSDGDGNLRRVKHRWVEII